MNRTVKIFDKVKKEKPLIHHITNWVTIYDCANIVRATGALPVMAHSPDEVADMVAISSALVLNIGTLTNSLVDAMKLAGKKANEKHIPVVLDAVGVGATRYRNEIIRELLKEIEVDVLKGNASEIASIAGLETFTKGVESTEVEVDLRVLAKKLAKEKNFTVVITGKEDIISNKDTVYVCKNGHYMMGNIVGTGCMAASMIGAFSAVEKDYSVASATALVLFGIAGELAAKKTKGPGSFKVCFYDALYNLSAKEIEDLEQLEKM
ncbi:hydroxyethylthiazole kinase [bacterium]|nr:hydroxyethylthiazole kinase [bacterium]